MDVDTVLKFIIIVCAEYRFVSSTVYFGVQKMASLICYLSLHTVVELKSCSQGVWPQTEDLHPLCLYG